MYHFFKQFPPPGGIVDEGVLEEGAEDEEDADPGPDVDGLRVRHRGQRVLDTCLRGGQGHGEDKCREISKYISSSKNSVLNHDFS